jgi:hypothetical protein
MLERLVKWHDWPNFAERRGENDKDLPEYKEDIAQSPRKGWLRVFKGPEKVTT